MAAAMAEQPQPLNAEPSRPDDRAAQHLPPKSYADAVEDPPPAEEHVSQANGVSNTNEISAPDENAKPGNEKVSQDPKRKQRRISSKPSRKTSGKASKEAPETNGEIVNESESDASTIVRERFKDANGRSETLTSIRPSADYEAQLRQDKKEGRSRRGSQLVSGRRAGAGWERSRWEHFTSAN